MRTLILTAACGFVLMGCATNDVPAEPEEAVDAAAEELIDCDPEDEDCDHTGSVIKPPQ